MKDFNLLIKQCYFIVLSVENKQIVKTQTCQRQRKESLRIYQNLQRVILANQDLQKIGKLVEY